MKSTKKVVIAAVVLIVLVAALFSVYHFTRPEAAAGSKTVTVDVIHGDESTKEFVIKTDAENLRGALEQENLIAGTESEYGIYIQTVDGETADESVQQWWCITRDGEMLMTGADDTMIADQEHYELTLTTGW